MDGRHVGLDFYDLLIEARYTGVGRIQADMPTYHYRSAFDLCCCTAEVSRRNWSFLVIESAHKGVGIRMGSAESHLPGPLRCRCPNMLNECISLKAPIDGNLRVAEALLFRKRTNMGMPDTMEGSQGRLMETSAG
jgi:hypothetical protein